MAPSISSPQNNREEDDDEFNEVMDKWGRESAEALGVESEEDVDKMMLSEVRERLGVE